MLSPSMLKEVFLSFKPPTCVENEVYYHSSYRMQMNLNSTAQKVKIKYAPASNICKA